MKPIDVIKDRRKLAILFVGLAVGLFIVWQYQGSNRKTEPENNVSRKSQRKEIQDLYEKQKFDDVIPKLQSQLKSEPQNQQLRSLLASSFWRTGKIDESFREYKKILKLDPSNGETLYLLSILAGQLKKPKQELDYTKKATTAKPESAQFKVKLARLYSQNSKHEEAIEIWKKLINEFDDTQVDKDELYFELAKVFIEVGDESQAREAIQAGLEKDPNSKNLLALQDSL